MNDRKRNSSESTRNSLGDPAAVWLVAQNSRLEVVGRKPILPQQLGVNPYQLAGIEPADANMLINQLNQSPIRRWEELDLSSVNIQTLQFAEVTLEPFTSIVPFTRFDFIAAMYPGKKWLSQPLVDFLTMKDEPGAELSSEVWAQGSPDRQELSVIKSIDEFMDAMSFNEDDYRLALDFKKQLLQEAEGRTPVVGSFILDRPEVEILDEAIHYDRMRVVVAPDGLFVSIVNEATNRYVPFFWDPHGVNTSVIWTKPQVTFGFDVLLSGLWRDLCVVQTETVEKSGGLGALVKSTKQQFDSQPLPIPRKVYKYEWTRVAGSGEENPTKGVREHVVTASYPFIGDGFPNEAAIQRALDHNWPPPPPGSGRTFRKPHRRGGQNQHDDPQPNVRRIAWRGRDTIEMILRTRNTES